MLVRIARLTTHKVAPDAHQWIGHIGRVIRLWDTDPDFGLRYEISGTPTETDVWPEYCLDPIPPPEIADDEDLIALYSSFGLETVKGGSA